MPSRRLRRSWETARSCSGIAKPRSFSPAWDAGTSTCSGLPNSVRVSGTASEMLSLARFSWSTETMANGRGFALGSAIPVERELVWTVSAQTGSNRPQTAAIVRRDWCLAPTPRIPLQIAKSESFHRPPGRSCHVVPANRPVPVQTDPAIVTGRRQRHGDLHARIQRATSGKCALRAGCEVLSS